MKFLRFTSSVEANGKDLYGFLEPENPDRVRVVDGGPISDAKPTDQVFLLKDVTLLPPVLPSKIVAVGVNYASHAVEMRKPAPKEPLIFLKPPTAVVGPGQVIRCPRMAQQVEYEGELAVVLGRRIRSVDPNGAKSAIWGYTCFNDVTARDLQKADGQWTRAKGFDTFAPLGPWVVTDLDPLDLEVQSRLNGRLVQSANTSQMLFDVYTLVSFISQVMTLLPGDVVTTGTPEGVGQLKPGDIIEVEVEGIGRLSNPVA